MSVSNIDFDLLEAADIQALSDRGVTLPLHYNQIKHYLPHRYPFMLIDRVTACKPNEWITGYKKYQY